MIRLVLSLGAEQAVRSCNLAMSKIDVSSPTSDRRIPRLDEDRLPGGVSWAIMQIVSIAESFDCGLFRVHVSDAIRSQHPAAQILWQKDADQAEKTWDARSDRWTRWFSVGVQTADPYKAFRPYIEVRNAVAHGLGSLTRPQLGKDGSGSEVRKSLQSIDVHIDGTRLLLSPSNAEGCATAAISYIRWLDVESSAQARSSRP